MLHKRISYKAKSKQYHPTSVLAAYSWERDLRPLPRHQTSAWTKKKRIVFHPVLFFPHVPCSYCESQYDLSERVTAKWAGRCQLLHPEGGWGATLKSEDLASYMKVAVNVAHYCFERLHLEKKTNTIYMISLRCFFAFILLILTKPLKCIMRH